MKTMSQELQPLKTPFRCLPLRFACFEESCALQMRMAVLAHASGIYFLPASSAFFASAARLISTAHRTQDTHATFTASTAGTLFAQNNGGNEKNTNVPASCLARIMAATFSLVFACSVPDIYKC